MKPTAIGQPLLHRVAGEDTPPWVAAGFATAGLCVAAAAAWLWLAGQPPGGEIRSAAPPVVEPQVVAPAAPPAVPSAPAAAVAAMPLASQATAASAASPVAAAPGADGADPATAPAPAAAFAAGVDPPAAKSRDCPPIVNLPFPFDSSGLAPAVFDTAAAELIAALRRHPQARVQVQGFADAAGPEPYNVLLSYRRATAVATLLGTAGIAAGRVSVRAAGSQELIEGLPRDAAANRRVTVELVGLEGCP